MPTNMFYSTIGSEILRIGRANSNVDSFLKSASSILARMSKRGAKYAPLGKVLKKMYGRHDVLHTFAANAKAFTHLLIG